MDNKKQGQKDMYLECSISLGEIAKKSFIFSKIKISKKTKSFRTDIRQSNNAFSLFSGPNGKE